MLALASVIVELTRSASRAVRTLALIFLFLPGLSLWSAAIGKDALTFSVCVLHAGRHWTLLNAFRPWVWPLFLLRYPPAYSSSHVDRAQHGSTFSGRVPMRMRVFFVLTIVPAASFGLTFALAYLGVENVAALQSYAYGIQSNNTQGSLSIDIVNMSIPARMLSYLYRPLSLTVVF